LAADGGTAGSAVASNGRANRNEPAQTFLLQDTFVSPTQPNPEI